MSQRRVSWVALCKAPLLLASVPYVLHCSRVQVMYGVPNGKEEEAQALTKNISSGLRGVMGAIDAK